MNDVTQKTRELLYQIERLQVSNNPPNYLVFSTISTKSMRQSARVRSATTHPITTKIFHGPKLHHHKQFFSPREGHKATNNKQNRFPRIRTLSHRPAKDARNDDSVSERKCCKHFGIYNLLNLFQKCNKWNLSAVHHQNTTHNGSHCGCHGNRKSATQ